MPEKIAICLDQFSGSRPFIESSNGKFRQECPNAHWFMGLDDTRTKMEVWRRDYNEVRPHGALGQKTPYDLVFGSGASGLP